MTMINRLTIKHALVASSILAAVFAHQAMAAGFQINEMSASLQGQALAGAGATTNDPSAMAYNPATLATVKGNQVQLGGSYLVPSISYNNATADHVPGGESGISAENSISPAALLPTGYAATTLPYGIHAGLAVNVPWGLSTKYNPNWAGNADAINSSVETVDIAPTLAYQIDKYVAVGAALHAQYASVDYSQNLLVDDILLIPSNLTGNSWGYGYSLGVLLTPIEGTNVGISYRSKITQDIKGTANETVLGTPVPIPANADITMPEVINIALSQQITSKLTGLATAQWTRWDRMQAITVYNSSNGTLLQNNTLDWKNSWMFSLGADYQLTDQWVLKSGVAMDQTPTQDLYRDARIPDSNRYWFTVGAGYTPVKNITLNMAYEHIFMMPQSIDVNTTPGYNLTADYHGSADIFAGSVNWTF